MADWYELKHPDRLPSPALLVYPDRVQENIDLMIRQAGGPERLRPHVKTHKMSEVTRMQLAAGIRQFKCSTIAEAEMVAECGAADLLLAYQPVGPNIERLRRLTELFPATTFSALADSPATVEGFEAVGAKIGLYIDVDCGMHRSGILPDERAVALYERIVASPVVTARGLHVYDGQIKEGPHSVREDAVAKSFAEVETLRDRIAQAGFDRPPVVAGGSPTFFPHAAHHDRQCSPGTTVFWDGCYRTRFPEMEFQNAALVLTRVISKPADDLLCLDLGYKSVSPDNPNPRVLFPQIPDAEMRVHSEEHLTIRTERANQFALGDVLYGIPWHICPTVALYSEAAVIREGEIAERWQVVARERMLTV